MRATVLIDAEGRFRYTLFMHPGGIPSVDKRHVSTCPLRIIYPKDVILHKEAGYYEHRNKA